MSHRYGVKCACGEILVYERLRGSVHIPNAKLIAKNAQWLARIGRDVRELNERLANGGFGVSFQLHIGSGGFHDEHAEADWFAFHEEHGGFVACVDYGETCP